MLCQTVQDTSVTEPQVNKGAIGKAFKKDAKAIIDHLTVLDEAVLTEMEKSLEDNG
jgi:glycyl-tRNA synthetase